MSRSESNESVFLKKLLLEKSETFCMLPWVHLHTMPNGVAAPCCIAECCATPEGFGNSRTQSLEELVNSKDMRQLRLDMLTGKKNVNCTKCYNHEKEGIDTGRQSANREWAHAFDDVVNNTNFDDGSIKDFKMRYFDIRFSNICNFKCRTCGAEFSTQWEQENLKNGLKYAVIHPKNNSPEFLKDVLKQVNNIETAYFAGGEPLITEEHYVVLEEMIRQGRTDIKLKYNTNLSNFNFKNKDILKLWSYFEKSVDVWASIDHYGERAEYIRHGTVWDKIEKNYLIAKNTPFINIQINTVLSVFNYLTIYEFYKYMIDAKMVAASDNVHTLYNMSTPDHLTCHILPDEYKKQGEESIKKTISLMKRLGFKKEQIAQLEITPNWVFSKTTWEEQKNKFREEVKRVDKTRGESFKKTFPELTELYKPDRQKMWPL